MEIVGRHISRTGLTAILVATLGAVGLGVASPASADGAVSACNGTCIVAYTAAKNTSNHTQYVSQLQVNYPRRSWSPYGYVEGWAGNGPSGIA